jgi:hypothetical protein
MKFRRLKNTEYFDRWEGDPSLRSGEFPRVARNDREIPLYYGGFDRLSHRHASLQLDKSSYQRN